MSRVNIRKPLNVRCAYYMCSVCSKSIDSYEYHAYGKCNNCRWL